MTKTEAKKQAELKACTLPIEGQERDVIQCTANKAFGFVKVGEIVWLVRSSDPSRYYVVHELEHGGYECSCPSCQNRHGAQCKHIALISERARIANLSASDLKREVFAFLMQFSTPLDKLENRRKALPQVDKPVANEQSEEEKRRESLLSIGRRGGYLSGRHAA